MALVEKFEDLTVWKTAVALTVEVYGLSKVGEFAKDFGFRDQIRRACVSIVSNISEGFERNSPVQFAQFLDIANGSTGEVRAQLFIAKELGYIGKEQFDSAIAKSHSIGKMIASLKHHIRCKQPLSNSPTL